MFGFSRKTILFGSAALLLLAVAFFLFFPERTVTRESGSFAQDGRSWPMILESHILSIASEEKTDAEPAKVPEKTLTPHDYFSEAGTFEETGSMEESTMADWWLNSGAYFTIEDGIGRTIQGKLAKDDKRRKSYAAYNASETDDGYHPQNIFRLVTKSTWQNFRQEAAFRVTRTILSADEHRDASNGLLFFNRYVDQNNLYYVGIRVDGYAVIKKKIHGDYYTLAYNQILPGTYSRKTVPNLLPEQAWIGMRSEVMTEADGSVHLKLFVDLKRNGEWELAAEAIDDGSAFGGAAITDSGFAGIRTDFMDVEFDDYSLEELPR